MKVKPNKKKQKMKTTKFYTEIKRNANDAELGTCFSYGINPDKDYYIIFLHQEPTQEVVEMCKDNGFKINQNVLHINENGKMVARNIWEVMPKNADEIEYVAK